MCHIVTRKPEPPPDEPEKKERVIHTRVPESLEAELRRRAQDLGISVSNLVRNSATRSGWSVTSRRMRMRSRAPRGASGSRRRLLRRPWTW